MQQPVKQALKDGLKTVDPKGTATWSSSTVPSTNSYKPGGTGIVNFNHISGRVKERGSDPLGRWTYVVYDGRGTTELLLISIYQCCKTTGADTGLTAHTQQKLMLSQLNRSNLDPCHNFHKDLSNFIRRQTSLAGISRTPLILGDWNETCTRTSTSQKLCDEFGLVDLWLHLHPHAEPFSTYTRGSRRLDFALAPLSLATKAIQMVYEPFHYRFFTDHRGFYIDFDTTLLFGSDTPQVYQPRQRGFSSNDSKAVTTYLTAFDAHLQHNNIYERLSSLNKSGQPDHQLIETIDREITRACQHAENHCRKRRMTYWSVELHRAKLKLSVWCQIRSRLRRHLPIDTIICRA